MRFGILLWSQAIDWPGLEAGARDVERLGYDHLWAWDHLYAIFGDPYQPIHEGWMTLAAWAKTTERIPLGLLVGANTFRNPGLVAKQAVTLDHISGGRAILGIGGAWFELEHRANGLEFGSGHGERLTWLDESVGAMRRLLDGEVVTQEGARYRFRDLRLVPGPLQEHLPIMIGGSGEKKTLRTVAKYADMWNAMGSLEMLRRKADVLREHCAAEGRDPGAIDWTVGCKPVIRDSEAEARSVFEELLTHNRTPIERLDSDDTFWWGTPRQIADRLLEYREIGFEGVIAEIPAPFDAETLERFVAEVKPLVDAG